MANQKLCEGKSVRDEANAFGRNKDKDCNDEDDTGDPTEEDQPSNKEVQVPIGGQTVQFIMTFIINSRLHVLIPLFAA